MLIEKKLTNGITAVIEKIDYVQSAAVGIFFKAGAVDEDPGKAGISHFIEHMMFKGTTNRTAKQIAEDVDMIGGGINAFTGKENTCYYIKTISENLEKGIEILEDMTKNSLFDPDEIEKEKNVIYEEMKMIEDTPDELAIDILGETVLKGVSTGKSIIGTAKTVGSIKREDIIDYMNDYYLAENVVISISGNVDVDKTVQMLEEHFSFIKAGKTNRAHEDYNYEQSFVFKQRDIEQTHLALGMEGYSYEDEDRFAHTVYSNILGGSMSSRLFQKVREEKGLAYAVQSFPSSFVDNGYFIIYAAVGQDKASEATEAIRGELKKFSEDGVTDYELKLNKEQLKGGYIFGQENVNKRMFAAGRNKLLLNRIVTDEEILKRIEDVTKDDIVRMAEKYSNLDEYTAVVLSKENINPDTLIKGGM